MQDHGGCKNADGGQLLLALIKVIGSVVSEIVDKFTADGHGKVAFLCSMNCAPTGKREIRNSWHFYDTSSVMEVKTRMASSCRVFWLFASAKSAGSLLLYDRVNRSRRIMMRCTS